MMLVSCRLYLGVMLKLLQSLIFIAVMAWVFHAAGNFFDPEHSKSYMLIGVAITVFALLLMFVEWQQRTRNLAIFVSTFSVPLIFGGFLASYTWVWIFLFILNIPVYLFVGKRFFEIESDFIFSLSNAFNGDPPSPMSPEEVEAGWKGQFYLICCAAMVTTEYKLITYLFF